MDCIFCKIAARQIPANIVHQDEQVTAFRDINPQAPTHILIIPNQHIAGVSRLTPEHAPTLLSMFAAANQIAQAEGIADNGYRLVINEGANAGQSVFHIHLHLLGGRQLTWPPG